MRTVFRDKNIELIIFYDGSCGHCARAISRYRRLAPSGRFQCVDVSGDHFCAGDYGRELGEFMAQMHVRDKVGGWHRGIDALLLIWSMLPGWRYRWFCRILRRPGFHTLADIGYRTFAANRHRWSGHGR